jgi:excisionase family DNA binding protein
MTRDEGMRSVEEAARVLGISRHTVRAWVRGRRLAHHRLGRRIVFSPEDLERFIRASRVPAKAPAARRA